jgi:GNAT superfamily N-acetyltransferase
MQPREWSRGEFVISTDRARLDVAVVHHLLSHSYWSPGIPLDVVRRSIEHSLPFGLYRGTEQVGFARVTTDFTTFGYLADVILAESVRGLGLGTWLMETVFSHPDLQGFRRWMLATRDAHGLYAKFGFVPLKSPELFMEKWDPEIYRRSQR